MVALFFSSFAEREGEREREGQSKRKSSSSEQQVVLQVKLGSLQITFYKPDLIVIVTCRWNFKDTPVPFALRFLVPISAEACCLNSIVYYPSLGLRGWEGLGYLPQ